MFSDKNVRKYKINGTFDIISDKIVRMSNDLIYLTIDIDGLDISLCPNTGTPVPGGLSFDHVINLLNKINSYGKKIIGADICETADAAIDSIVSIRVLYKLLGSISRK
jgi:agmatinase